MPTLSGFLKQNKKVKENVFYPATASLCDEKGEPLLWELRPVPTKEDEALRASCVTEIPMTGKPGMFRDKTNTDKYIAKLLVASVVSPDLLNAEIQDSYGVKTPEDLLKAMIDESGEYTKLVAFVQKFNGMDLSFGDEVKQAKN